MTRPSLKTANEVVAFQKMQTKLNKIQKARKLPLLQSIPLQKQGKKHYVSCKPAHV